MDNVNYQFTAVPTNLFLCLDNNCRSMLFSLVQLSTYYAKEDGFFFRTNADLQAESNLSANVVRATLSVLYDNGLVEVSTVGMSNGKTPNLFRVNFANFKKWDNYTIEECAKDPRLKITTPDYRAKGFSPSYMKNKSETEKPQATNKSPKSLMEEMEEKVITYGSNPTDNEKPCDGLSIAEQVMQARKQKACKSEHNIDNIYKEDSIRTERANDSSDKDGFKNEIDRLCNEMANTKAWTSFVDFREKLRRLDVSDRQRAFIEKRIEGLERSRLKYFSKVAANNLFHAEWTEIYEKANVSPKGGFPNSYHPIQTVETSKAEERPQTVESPNTEKHLPKNSSSEDILIERRADYEDNELESLFAPQTKLEYNPDNGMYYVSGQTLERKETESKRPLKTIDMEERERRINDGDYLPF